MSEPTRDGDPWDGTCPTCHKHVADHVVGTRAPNGSETFTSAWHCPNCDYWWDYRGRPIEVKA